MSDELKIGYISKQCLEKLQDPKWQALRGVWVELWTVDGPPSRCVVPVYTFSQNASAQAVDNSSDDSQPMKPGPFVYSAEAEIKGLRTQLAAMTAERDRLQTCLGDCMQAAIQATAQPRQPLSAWIACSDRLPDEGTHVLGYDAGLGKQLTCFLWVEDYDNEATWRDVIGDPWPGITHWQPLPAAPERAITGEKL